MENYETLESYSRYVPYAIGLMEEGTKGLSHLYVYPKIIVG